MLLFRAIAIPAMAADRVDFDIARQRADRALVEFARQAQLSVLLPAARISQVTTNALRGNYAVQDGLAVLLRDTGLRGQLGATGTLTISLSRPEGESAAVAQRSSLMARVRASLAGALSNGGQAAPEQRGAGSSGALEEIVVTARRVEESIQRVPIAVTAMDEDALQRLDIRDILQLTRTVPGIKMCCTTFNNLVYTRGIDRGSPTYFADVPVDSAGFANFFDIASVQVLKGPQGTLFGQASNAGAFVYEPHRPGDKLGGFVSLTGGSHGRRTLEGAVDLPLISGRLVARLAAITHVRDGYVRDLSNGLAYGNEDYYVVRPSVNWKITDRLQNYTLFQYSHAETNGMTVLINVLGDVNFNPDQVQQNWLLLALNGGNQAAFDALREQALLEQRALGPYVIRGLSTGCASPTGPIVGPTGNPPGGVPAVTSLNYPSVACPHAWYIDRRIVNTTSWQISESWSVRNIHGRTNGASFNQPNDVDGTVLILTDIGSPLQSASTPAPAVWSNELQLRGSIGRFDVTAGTFHTRQTQDTGRIHGDYNTVAPTLTQSVTASQSHAVYAQTNIRLTGRLSATLGVRRTRDELESITYNYSTTTGALINTSGGPNSPSGHARFDNTSYTAGLQLQATPDTLWFVTNSKGSAAGVLQDVVNFEVIEPSQLNNVEVGVKSTFGLGQMRARVNASAFYGRFANIQAFVFELATNPATGQQGLVGVRKNAAKADIRGFEGDFTLLPTPSLRLGAVVGYLDNEYTDFPSRNPLSGAPIDLTDTPFLLAPAWTFGGRASYRLPFSSAIGRVSLTADVSYHTKLVVESKPRVPTDPANPTTGHICTRARTIANGYPAALADGGTAFVDCRHPSTNLDIGAQWSAVMGNENVTLNFAVNNVTRNIYTDSSANVVAGGYTSPQPAVPRMWSLRLRYSF